MAERVEAPWTDWDEDEVKTDYEMVTEIDISSGHYEFSLYRFYRKVSTDELFYAFDSGCSCPTPFEDLMSDALTPVTSLQHFYAVLDDIRSDEYNSNPRLEDDIIDATKDVMKFFGVTP
jgi:hypothetical protein